MANESESGAGVHPVTAEEETSGWSGGEVVHDQSARPAGGTGWQSEGVVRDQGTAEDDEDDSGWSGSAVVRDQGESSATDTGGWSASEVVKDHGEEPTA